MSFYVGKDLKKVPFRFPAASLADSGEPALAQHEVLVHPTKREITTTCRHPTVICDFPPTAKRSWPVRGASRCWCLTTGSDSLTRKNEPAKPKAG